MREIKFRVWDTKEKTFIISKLQYLLDGTLKAEPGGILMQYTGLKDKNGKEIYEGDILHWRSWVDTAKNWEEGLKQGWGEGKQVVKFELNNKFQISRFQGMGFGKEEEVIGNIYENPDLLQKD